MYKTISPFFYYSELIRYERKSFIGHQYFYITCIKVFFTVLSVSAAADELFSLVLHSYRFTNLFIVHFSD